MAVDRILDRAREHFPIRDISVPFAHLGADPFDAEPQVSARPFDTDAVRFFHAPLQRNHCARHFAIVHRANIKIQIFERLGAHAGPLGHARRRPAQHAPARFVHSIIQHRTNDARIQRHLIAGHIRIFTRVCAAADRDIGLHLFHARQFQVPHQSGMALISLAQQLAVDPCMADFDDRDSSCRPCCAQQLDRKLIGYVDHIQQHPVSLFQLGRIFDQQLRQFFVSWISHKKCPQLSQSSPFVEPPKQRCRDNKVRDRAFYCRRFVHLQPHSRFRSARSCFSISLRNSASADQPLP